MKLIITLLAVVLFVPVTFAQQYQSALEVPDLVKEGYKGKVKKIHRETYSTKTVQGKLVQDKITDIMIDSFSANGFLMNRSLPIDKRQIVYNLNDKGYTDGNVSSISGKKYSKKVATPVDKYSYVVSTYKYDNTEKQFSTTAKNTDTFILSTDYRITKSSESTNEYLSGGDTVVYTMLSEPLEGLEITITALEKDKQGNITRARSESELEQFIVVYKYEYYQ